MADKTLKQIADELGIDKQKVYRYVTKNNIKEALQSGQVKLYDETAQKQIKRYFSEKEQHHEAQQNHSNDTVIESLLRQLETKDKQINKLLESLQFEQGKNKELQDKILVLEDKAEQLKEKDEVVEVVEPIQQGSSVFNQLTEEEKKECEEEAKEFWRPLREWLSRKKSDNN